MISRDLLLLLAATVSMIACTTTELQGPRTDPLKGVSAQEWQALASRSIYFGHQSVGGNILDGVRDLIADDRRMPIVIIPGVQGGPGLHEFAIGENGDPVSKMRDFGEIVSRGNVPKDAILMFKLCFVDIRRDTDVAALFAQYREAIAALHREHPGATVIHVTMPLTTSETTPKFLVRQLLGRPGRGQVNVLRNRFNDLLRDEYAAKEPIFDLAEAEATRADGTRSFFSSGGKRIYNLAREWASDGSHLNENGRRFVAARFLATLTQCARVENATAR